MFPISSSSSNPKSENNIPTSSSSSTKPTTTSASSSTAYPTGPLSPNSAEFMALLEKQFRSQVTSSGGGGGGGDDDGMGGMSGLNDLTGLSGISGYGGGGLRSMGMSLNMNPSIDNEAFRLGNGVGGGGTGPGGGGGGGGKVDGGGLFGNLDSFLPYTNQTINLASLNTSSSSRNPIASGTGGVFQPSMNTLGGGKSYGVQIPEGSSGSRRVVSGSAGGGAESSASTEESPGAGGSGSGSGSVPTTKNTGRGTVIRHGSGDASSSGIAHSKRKAEGDGIRGGDVDDESGSSDEDEVPTTTRRTTKTTTATSASRRKSALNSGTPTSGGGGGENKAMKRKEQNRAAQKAFRERREQRVKDLEDKVRDLEEQSFGQSIENENLRQLLSKLQQENKTLVQTSFSFKGPMPTMNDLNAGNLQVLQSAPSVSAREPAMRTIKPPSPPNSVVQDSRKDSQTSQDGPSPLGGRGSNDRTDMTPASTMSKSSSSSSPPGISSSGTASGFFTAEPYSAFATGTAFGTMDGGLPPAYGVAPSQIHQTQQQNTQTFPSSSTPNRMASPQHPGQQQQQRQQQQSTSTSEWMIMASSTTASDPSDNTAVNAATPFTILSQNPAFTSFRDDTPFGNIGNLGFGTFDYRDTGRLDTVANDFDDPFAGLDGMGDAAMEEFLKNLADGTSGSTDNAVVATRVDSAFSVTADGMQVMNPEHSKYYMSPGVDAMDTGADLLDAYLRDSFPSEVNRQWAENAARNQSGSSASGSKNAFLSPTSATSNSAFSPSNYFTLSPEPQVSTAPSSVSRHDSTSSGSPMQSQTSVIVPKGKPLSVGTLGSAVGGEMCEGGAVMSKEGKLLSPEQMWAKVSDRLDLSEGLDMDDLCSQLKAKAVCGGVGPVVPEATLDRALDEYAAHKRATAIQMQGMTD